MTLLSKRKTDLVVDRQSNVVAHGYIDPVWWCLRFNVDAVWIDLNQLSFFSMVMTWHDFSRSITN